MAGVVIRPSAPVAATPSWLPPAASALALGLSAFLLTLVILLAAWVSLPRLAFGWDAVTITSGSMRPALRPGDVVLVEPHRGGVPGEGDVVAFRDRAGGLVTHRVVEVLPDGTLRTQGDANRDPDPTLVALDRVEGRGRLVVPAGGLPTLWAQQGRWYLLVGLAGLVALAAQAVGDDLRPSRLLARAAAAGRALRRRRSPSPRRGRVARERAVVAGVSVLAVAAGFFGTGQDAVAAFLGATDTAGSFAAGSVMPTANLAATGSCIQPGGTRVIDLSWDAVTSATSYRVLRADATGGPYTEVGAPTAPAFQDDQVTNGTTYFYVVRAVQGSWESADSAEVSATAPQGCGGGGGGGGGPR